MLLIRRNESERIQIGDNIFVTIVAVEGKQVQLGVQAPRDMEIHRHKPGKSRPTENTNANRQPPSYYQSGSKVILRSHSTRSDRPGNRRR